ncbi:MAG: hypothetical protein DI536_28990 [Archangium gephyra]|uniref:DUF6884 domain-containing protein n=1 Tax=Archangium gephyra TaxID=48 RepID=A0A2W5T6K3_9BACT|nr:MAG: hypothetical protein DI536_28990 [Archangium gephyra]
MSDEHATSQLEAELLELDAQLAAGDASARVELPGEAWQRLVRLAKGEHLARRKPYALAVLACSATKLNRRAPARELYTGELFTLSRQLAELVAERFVILSAMHGVVASDVELEPYNWQLTARAAPAWSAVVASALKLELAQQFGKCLWLAPDTYSRPIARHDRSLADVGDRPLKGLGIGQQKARLAELIAEARRS